MYLYILYFFIIFIYTGKIIGKVILLLFRKYYFLEEIKFEEIKKCPPI